MSDDIMAIAVQARETARIARLEIKEAKLQFTNHVDRCEEKHDRVITILESIRSVRNRWMIGINLLLTSSIFTLIVLYLNK